MWLALFRTFWPAIPGAIAAFALSWLIGSVSIAHVRTEAAKALTAQATQIRAECAASKHLTEEISGDYQKNLGRLGIEYDALGVRASSVCVPVLAAPADGCAPPAPGHKPAGPHGVAAGAILDLAREGEQYRLQLKACQQFVLKTWAAHDHQGN